MARFCRVALDSPVGALDRPFDYEIPERLRGRVHPGSVVRVVLHGRSMRAFVTELLDEPAVAKPRPLRSLVSPDPLFGPDEIALATWTSRRYVTPLGLVLHDAVPGRFSTVRGQTRAAATPEPGRGPVWLKPNLGRRTCLFPPTLGSQSDAVAYLAGEAARSGGRTLVICPRTETAAAIAQRIDGATLMHGDSSPGERAEAWAAARDARPFVVVGTRAALFVPIPDLKLVVVASAHDRSLKSERAPRLHAAVVAAERARRAGAAFVVSSPAPPLEFAYGADWQGAKRRDLKPETVRPRTHPVTERLLDVVRWTIERERDALVFVGRRGEALRLRCRDCGWTPTCDECGTGLQTNDGRLLCRVCGRASAIPDECASCGGLMTERGWGHERIARELERANVGAPVVRIVAGEVPAERPRPAVIVGTLAAAHAIGTAGSVCVTDLDQALMRPDFRASEYALQTLHELASVLAPDGRFLIQTREPEHHAVQAFMRQSYRYFFDREIASRKDTGYPPFGAVVRVETDAAAIDALRASVLDVRADVVGSVIRKGKVVTLVRGPELEAMLDPLRSFSLAHPRTKIDVDPVDIV